MPFILRVKEFTNHRLWSLEKLQQGDLRKRFLCFCVIFFSMSFSETERTQFKDTTVKYWLFTPLKNGLKMEESRLINSVACWNSSKHSTSPYLNLQVQLFSLGILGLFFKIKMQNWALSRQPNFNFFFFLAVLVSLFVTWLAMWLELIKKNWNPTPSCCMLQPNNNNHNNYNRRRRRNMAIWKENRVVAMSF